MNLDVLNDVLAILFKHKGKIALVTISTIVVTAVALMGTSRPFEAKTSLLFKFGREYVYRSEFGDRRPVSPIDLQNAINGEVQILNSRDVKLGVLENIGIERIYPESVGNLESAVETFEANLTIKNVENSNVVHVYFRNIDPQIAALTLNTLVDVFFEKRLGIFSETKLPFLIEQRDMVKDNLYQAEADLQKFSTDNQIFSIDEETRLLVNQKGGLATSLNETKQRISELRRRIKSFQSQLQGIPKNVALYSDTRSNEVVEKAKARLLELQLEEQALLAKFREDSRVVRQIGDEIQGVRSLLKSTEQSAVGTVRVGQNSVFQQVELDIVQSKTELTSLEARLESIEPALLEINSKLKSLDGKAKILRNKQREIAALEKRYQTYVEQVEEARVIDELDRQKQTNIRVIQDVVVPDQLLGLSNKKKLAMSSILGLIGGVFFAFLFETLRGTFSTSRQLRDKTGLRVLATVASR